MARLMDRQKASLTPEESDRKRRFFKASQFSSEPHDTQREYAETVGLYLNIVYGIQIPENFAERLQSAHNAHYSLHQLHIPYSVIDSVVAACKKWLDFIDPDFFSTLVVEEVFSMVQIHCIAVRVKDFQVKGMSFTKAPPPLFTTVVNKWGLVQIFGI